MLKIMKEKENYIVPIKGSLGLLAAGYKGIMLWRMKKLGAEDADLKIIPPIVFGKILKVTKVKIETE